MKHQHQGCDEICSQNDGLLHVSDVALGFGQCLFRSAMMIKLTQRPQVGVLIAQEITTEKPGNSNIFLIANESPGWYGEDIVKFFQGTLFGFRNQAEDQTKGDDIESTLKKLSASLCSTELDIKFTCRT